MPLNRWIEHIRKFARENNMTYSCALSDPNLKDGYIPAPKRMGKRATAAAVAERESLEMGAEDINRAKAKKAPAKRMKRVIDIVGRTDSETGRVYYYNRFHDKSEAYGIVNNKVMIIGEVIEDYDDVNFFDDPKPVASNVRFYNSDKKPIPKLNNLQEGLPAKAPSPAKKAPSPAPVGLTEAEKRRLKQAKEQLAYMDRIRNMGMMMDEDQREEIEGTIRDLERRMSGKGMDIYGRGRYRDIDYTRTIPHHKFLEMFNMF